jgi:hypothetical protein
MASHYAKTTGMHFRQETTITTVTLRSDIFVNKKFRQIVGNFS